MSEQVFKAKSATRVDLAGGTLDLWPLSALVPNATTVNASIDCYTTVEFKKGDSLKVKVQSPDFDEEFNFSNRKEFLIAKDSKLTLLQEAFSLFEGEDAGLGEWFIKSESPAGSGLGGSSSLLISIVKVIFQIQGKTWTEEEIINTSKNIESRVLKTPAGIQDYFSPVKKGINLISYKEKGFQRETLNEHVNLWADSLTIVDSQIKHHSGMNNWDILKKYIDGDSQVVEALHDISRVSLKTKKAIASGDFSSLKKCFEEELEARKKVSDSYINEELERFLKNLGSVSGVEALKVCGAGGGGCVLILHETQNKKSIQEILQKENVKVLPFVLTTEA